MTNFSLAFFIELSSDGNKKLIASHNEKGYFIKEGYSYKIGPQTI